MLTTWAISYASNVASGEGEFVVIFRRPFLLESHYLLPAHNITNLYLGPHFAWSQVSSNCMKGDGGFSEVKLKD